METFRVVADTERAQFNEEVKIGEGIPACLITLTVSRAVASEEPELHEESAWGVVGGVSNAGARISKTVSTKLSFRARLTHSC